MTKDQLLQIRYLVVEIHTDEQGVEDYLIIAEALKYYDAYKLQDQYRKDNTARTYKILRRSSKLQA